MLCDAGWQVFHSAKCCFGKPFGLFVLLLIRQEGVALLLSNVRPGKAYRLVWSSKATGCHMVLPERLWSCTTGEQSPAQQQLTSPPAYSLPQPVRAALPLQPQLGEWQVITFAATKIFRLHCSVRAWSLCVLCCKQTHMCLLPPSSCGDDVPNPPPLPCLMARHAPPRLYPDATLMTAVHKPVHNRCACILSKQL